MKVGLVNPNWRKRRQQETTYNRVWVPLSLTIAASLLKNHNIDPVLVDANAENLSTVQVIDRIRDCDKIFVTTSPYDRWQCPDLDIQSSLRVFKALKDKESYVLGHHVNVNPLKILQATNATAGILGSPEFTILEICKAQNLTDVNNIVFLSKGKVLQNKIMQTDINQLSIPAYDLLDPNNYEYEILGKRFGLVETSRGCPHQCSFCNSSKMFGKYSEIILENTIANVRMALNAGFQVLYFMDLNFLSNPIRIKKLCSEIIKRDLRFKWCCQTRIDNLDAETAELLRKAGCELVHIGVEMVSDAIQKATQKNLKFASIEKNTRLLKQNNIKSVYFVMLGLGEQKEDIRRTRRFILRTKPNYVSVHYYTDFSTLKKRQISHQERYSKFILIMTNIFLLKAKDLFSNPVGKARILAHYLKA